MRTHQSGSAENMDPDPPPKVTAAPTAQVLTCDRIESERLMSPLTDWRMRAPIRRFGAGVSVVGAERAERRPVRWERPVTRAECALAVHSGPPGTGW